MTLGRRVSLGALVLLMAGSGVLHLRKPDIYTPIVPQFLGPPQPYVLWSGVLQILCGLLLAVPATRRVGALLAAAVLIGVFPANIQMALEGPRPGGGWFTGSRELLWLRLPIQPLLVYWSWTFARRRLPAGGGVGSSAGMDPGR